MRNVVLMSLMSSLALGAMAAALAAPPTAPPAVATAGEVRQVEVIVEGGAYTPKEISIKAGERLRLHVVRKDYAGCTREIVIPALDVRRELPPNKVVVIELPPLAAGQYEYRCGMNMVRGTITVDAR